MTNRELVAVLAVLTPGAIYNLLDGVITDWPVDQNSYSKPTDDAIAAEYTRQKGA